MLPRKSAFQLLQGFDVGSVRPPIVFYAFDLLRLNGEDFRGLPIEERKVKLAALLKNTPRAVRYSASFTENIDELLNMVRELSLERLIGNVWDPSTIRNGPKPGLRSKFTNRVHL
jgi:bifunctional non-homologous end joining protein LigD